MLTIDRHQFKRLEDSSRRLFHDRLYQRLETYHCALVKNRPKADVLDQMAAWHQRAIAYGMDTKKVVGRFLGLHLIVLPDYDLQKSVKKLLDHPAMNGEQKMAALFSRLRQHDLGRE
jgi:hypothetical protein